MFSVLCMQEEASIQPSKNVLYLNMHPTLPLCHPAIKEPDFIQFSSAKWQPGDPPA